MERAIHVRTIVWPYWHSRPTCSVDLVIYLIVWEESLLVEGRGVAAISSPALGGSRIQANVT